MHGMEPTLFVEEAIGGKKLEMRMIEEVIAKSVNDGIGGDSATGKTEARADSIAQGFCDSL